MAPQKRKIQLSIEIEVETDEQERQAREFAEKIGLFGSGPKALFEALGNAFQKGFVGKYAYRKA